MPVDSKHERRLLLVHFVSILCALFFSYLPLFLVTLLDNVWSMESLNLARVELPAFNTWEYSSASIASLSISMNDQQYIASLSISTPANGYQQYITWIFR